MNPSPIATAEALLAEVEQSRPLKDRAAWAILHQDQLADCVRELIAFQAGMESEQRRLALLASKLLAAIAPLLSHTRGRRDFIDEWMLGTAPKLQRAYEELSDYLSQ